MKKSFSYHDCYLILGINSNCNWAELRRTYKKLIQKWHPDRYEDGSKEKNLANDKIKSINFAYKQIKKYYNDNNNTLPPFEQINADKNNTHEKKPNSTTTNKTTQKPTPSTTHSDSVTTKTNTSAKTTRKPKTTYQQESLKTFNRIRNIGLTITIIIASIYYFYPDNLASKIPKSIHNNPAKKAAPYFSTAKKTIKSKNHFEDNLQQKKIDNNNSGAAKEVFFTNGSSITDVIRIQGIPSKTDNDIWYYGDSEVHFENGAVSHWVRAAHMPLKARLTITTQDTLKTKKTYTH